MFPLMIIWCNYENLSITRLGESFSSIFIVIICEIALIIDVLIKLKLAFKNYRNPLTANRYF